MLQRFIDWWNKSNGNPVKRAEGLAIEGEYRFNTTLARDLKLIGDLLGKEFPKHISPNIRGGNGRRIDFRSEGYSIRNIKNEVNLKSFRVDNDLSNIDIVYWSVDISEYKTVYESKYKQYANSVRELLATVEREFDNPTYYYIFSKYEDSIYIVANTLKDVYEHNGGLDDEVFQKVYVIIWKFKVALEEKTSELKHIEKLQHQAVSKSLIDRLDNEIEFIDKYLEVN